MVMSREHRNVYVMQFCVCVKVVVNLLISLVELYKRTVEFVLFF